jgi:hypothetical protein
MDKVTAEFRVRHPGVAMRGGRCLVPVELCLEYVGICEKHSIPILGFEGFCLSKETMIPLADGVADYSECMNGASPVGISIESARSFFASYSRPGVWFEFVLSGTRT